MNKQAWIVLILLLALAAGLFWWRTREVKILEEQVVYKSFLPIVLAPPEPLALKGVGLSKPFTGDVGALRCSWYTNWDSHPPPDAPLRDRRFVPMQYNNDLRYLSNAVAHARVGSGWLLGFNEPDRSECGNVSPAAGAIAWREIEAQGHAIKLVSPAPSQHDPSWLWRMVDEYERLYGRKPRFDAIAWHIYTANPNTMKNYLIARRQEALARGYDVPIWVTEWGGLCTLPDPQNGNERLMREMIPWMETQSWITRYAWFASRIKGDEHWGQGWQHCSLINPDTGQLKLLGTIYRRY